MVPTYIGFAEEGVGPIWVKTIALGQQPECSTRFMHRTWPPIVKCDMPIFFGLAFQRVGRVPARKPARVIRRTAFR
jgi:hypothetical protein